MALKKKDAPAPVALPATPAAGQVVEDFVDVADAAKFMKVSVETIYKWAQQSRRNRFPVRHHGRRLAFLRSELRAWSDEQNGRAA